MKQMYTEEELLDRIRKALRFGWYSCQDALEFPDAASLEEAEDNYLDYVSTGCKWDDLESVLDTKESK